MNLQNWACLSASPADCLTAKDLVLLLLGAAVSVVIAFAIYTVKPRLKITVKLCKKSGRHFFKIRVENRTWLAKAVNLRIEACFTKGHYTYHCEIDRGDFLMLARRPLCGKSRDHYRTFKTHELAASAKIYKVKWREHIKNLKSGNENVRVRIHATHEFTGFGKAREATYACVGKKLKLQ
jgi:hypothetical protein